MYSAQFYEVLFDQENTLPELIQWGEVGRMRTMTVDAGPRKSVKIFPVWKIRDEASIAKAEKKKSRAAQVALNERNSRERLRWLMDANFGEGSILCTPTFDDGEQPDTDEEALDIIRWYIRQIRNIRKRKGLDEMKYIYVIEKTEDAKRGTRYHYHVVMNGDGLDREEVEALWGKRFTKSICNTKRYQKNDRHMGGWAAYMNLDKPTQTKATKRRWNCSKNLKKPKVRTSDHKISRAKAQKIVKGFQEDAKKILEKAYPGYVLMDEEAVKVKTSAYVQGVYIYAEMRKRD